MINKEFLFWVKIIFPGYVVRRFSWGQFKEFEPGLKYGWFHLKLYSIVQDLSRRSIEPVFGGIWDAA